MKKNLFSMGVMLAAAFTLTNCAKEVQDPNVGEKTPYTIYANTAETKTANDGLSTVWVEGDALTVFATAAGSTDYGTSSKFTLTDAASGKFETDDLKADLAATNDWYALYPYSSYVTTPASTDAGYIYFGNKNGLTQEEYNSTSHLSGNSCPLYGVAKAVPGEDLPGIQMQHLTSVVQINVKNGTSSTFAISDLSFTSSACDIVGHYFVDFTKDVPGLTPREGNVSKTALLTVKNPTDLTPNQTASFYIVVRPFTAPANSTLTIKIGSVDEEKTLAEDVVFAAGKIKGINYTLTEVPVEVPPTKATVEDFLAAAEDDTWYELTGTISNLANTKYGNFDLTDATGTVYVYGLTKTKVASNDQSFASIGLKEGDVVTLIGKRSSHSGTPRVGGPAYYVSHVAGEEPEPEPGTGELTHPLTSNLVWTVDSATKSYSEKVIVNSNDEVPALKLGASSAVGVATITIPAGTTKVGYYGVAWNGKSGTITASSVAYPANNGQFYTQDLAANEGIHDKSPYTLTSSDADYYEIDVVSILGTAAPSDIPVTLSTVSGATRVVIWGLNYYTASGIGADQSGSEPDPEQPTAPQTVTIAEFNAAEDGATVYELTGTITDIYEAYNSEYKNISFYIEDATAKTLVFRMSCEGVADPAAITVGDEITVQGTKTTYNESPQMAKGGKYISHTDKDASEETDADVVVDFTNQKYSDAQEVTSLTVDGVTVTLDKGTNNNTPKWYNSGNAVRVYGGGTFTVSASKAIASIKLTYGSSDKSNAITADVGTFDTDTWTGSANNVTFTVGDKSGHRRIAKIAVYYN